MPLARPTDNLFASPPQAPTLTASGTDSLKANPASLRGTLWTASSWTLLVLSLVGTSLLVALACLSFGAERISFFEMGRILWQAAPFGRVDSDGASTASIILLQIRLPRILLSALVGGSLAAVGVVLQALLRNPLADPFVLGISSGAALGAGLAVLLGIGTTVWAVSTLPLFAFAGGLLSLGLLHRMAKVDGRLPVAVLLLAGVILNAVFSASLMFVTSIMEPSRSFGMMSWLMGTLMAPTSQALLVLAGYLVVGSVVLARLARPLNLLALGEPTARSLGVEVERVKQRVFIVSALMTGAVVSVSGMIGFVGMLIPHSVRMVIGADHRLLLPASFLVGAMFLMIADTLSRTILAPAEIPVGIVTALMGGPFFLYLLMSRKGGILR
jgi:iron complex transport system permease protein